MESSGRNYKPGPDFESDKNQALLDTNPTDSTELWLIQLPLHQLQPDDFNGKEIKLKEKNENLLAEFASLSGKSYEVTISGDKHLDAAVCIAPGLFRNVSRTVRVVHYPEPEEFEKTRGLSTINLSSLKTTGSVRKTTSKFSTPVKNSISKFSHGTQGSAPKSGQGSVGSSHNHKKKKHEGTNESQASGSKLGQSNAEKKRKIKVEVEDE